MSALAGLNKPFQFDLVNKMLDRMAHRANKFRMVFSTENSTFGIISNYHINEELENFKKQNLITHNLFNVHFAYAKEFNRKIELGRDFLGVVPLYYGFDEEGVICFASEVKGLLIATRDVNELKPGNKLYDKQVSLIDEIKLPDEYLNHSSKEIANELRTRIENSILKHISNNSEFGSWLSGGIDSSIISCLARPHLKKLYTFSSGLENSSDLKYARIVAEKIKSEHSEIVVTFDEIIKALPQVIYYLESFDAYLVRSTIINYIVTSKAKNYIDHVFSGESGDELFAGYDYLKSIQLNELPNELIKITKALSNTAFQRVDRSAYSHGIIPHLPFSDPEVVNYSLKIPPELKIHNGIEKWILRESARDILPDEILNRPKEKFWQGSGIKNILEDYAEQKITNDDFRLNRNLKNGFTIRTKEEFLYYKIFEEHFGEFENFHWLGFTNITPQSTPV